MSWDCLETRQMSRDAQLCLHPMRKVEIVAKNESPRIGSKPPTLPKSSQWTFNVPPPHRQGMPPDLRLYVLVWEDETMESKESCLGTQRGGVTALQWNAVKCITDRNPASAGIRYSYARSSAQSAPQNETQPSSGFESGHLHLSRTELTEVYSASITTPPCLFIKRFFQSVTSQKVAKKYPLLHNFAHKPYSRRPTCCFNKLIDWNSIVLKKKTLRVNFTAKYNGYVYISDIHTIGFGYKCCNWAPYVHGGIALVPVPMFLVLLLKRCLKNVRSI